MKKEKILVPVSFSPTICSHLDYSLQMAKTLDARIVIANILKLRDVKPIKHFKRQGHEIDESLYIQELKSERTEILNTYFLKNPFPKDRLRYHFGLGDPAMELLKYIIFESIDLVILGDICPKEQPSSVATKLFNKCPATVICYRDEKHRSL
jgi:hypothetical protein